MTLRNARCNDEDNIGTIQWVQHKLRERLV